MNFNKQNKIMIGALVLLVVLSVGYALFSDSVEIKGSATAQGNFQITSSCNAGLSAFLEQQIGSENIPIQGGYSNESCDVNGTEVSYGATLEFPTAARTFTITMENTGSIPAKINLENGVTINSTISVGEETIEHAGFAEEMALLFNIDGQLYMDVEELPAENLDDEGNVIVRPNDSVIYVVFARWSETFGSNDYNHQTLTSVNTLKVNFEQVTAQ